VAVAVGQGAVVHGAVVRLLTRPVQALNSGHETVGVHGWRLVWLDAQQMADAPAQVGIQLCRRRPMQILR